MSFLTQRSVDGESRSKALPNAVGMVDMVASDFNPRQRKGTTASIGNLLISQRCLDKKSIL